MGPLPDLSAVRDVAGLAWRPATLGDVHAVVDLVNNCDRHDLEAVALSASERVVQHRLEDVELLGYWQRPSFDLRTDSMALFDGGRLVAYAEVFKGRRADAHVHPDARGRGLGSALLRWTVEVSRARGRTLIGQTVLAGSDAAALLEASGYDRLYTSWVLDLPPAVQLASGPLPAGTSIEALGPHHDRRAAYDVTEDAFNEWEGREPTSFEDWQAVTVLRPGFEPWQLQVAVEQGVDGAPTIVGAIFVVPAGDDAWVNAVAVRGDRRGRGLGRALLVAAIGAARARGLEGFGLGTNSRTGTLGLYEYVGMRVTQTWVHYAVEV